MKLYLIRHGESENNRTGHFTGWFQAPLSEKGIKDAEEVRKYIKDVLFDKVYTSDLIRAKKTAETAIPGCEYEETSLLREIHLGELEGKKISYCESEYGEVYVKNRSIGNYKPFGGENDEEFLSRLKSFLDIAKNSNYENIAAFCHGGVLRRIVKHVLGVSISRTLMPCRNCAILVLENTDGEWILHSWINTQ